MVNQTKDVFLKSHMKPPVTKIIFKSNSEPKVGQRRTSLKEFLHVGGECCPRRHVLLKRNSRCKARVPPYKLLVRGSANVSKATQGAGSASRYHHSYQERSDGYRHLTLGLQDTGTSICLQVSKLILVS